VLDAGTGIRELGLKLDGEGVNKLDLLFSHFHMDHTQGFPFFTPAYQEGTQIDIYAAPWAEHSLAEPFHRLMDQPSFPVPFKYMSADINFHEMNGSTQLGDVLVRSQLVNHPGGCIAFSLQYAGKTLIYLTDHEPYGSAQDQEIRDFTRGADVLIREAQYTNAEYESKRGWGHSRFEDAVSDAIEAGVKRLAITHHDPQHDDLFLERELAELRSRYGSSKLDIFLAREGDSVVLS
jgi:phosphoribosyl 1,2-cyclic phosphodiesterase